MTEKTAGRAPTFPPVCGWCRYWKPGDGNHCEAYPTGGRYSIPPALLRGEVSRDTGYGHLLPLPHDHGLLFVLTGRATVSPPWLAEAKAKAQAAKASEGQPGK